MKISDLIQKLQELMQQHGDLPVTVNICDGIGTAEVTTVKVNKSPAEIDGKGQKIKHAELTP